MINIPRFVTPHLHHSLKQHASGLLAKELFLRAILYLKLIAHRDPRTGDLLFHEAAMASIRQRPSLAEHNKTRLQSFLGKLKRALPDGTFEYRRHAEGRCTQVTKVELPSALEEAFARDRERHPRADLVDAQTGAEFRSRHRRQIREEQREQAETHLQTPKAVRELQGYLNGHAPRSFTRRLEEHKDEALAVLRDPTGAYRERSERYDAILAAMRPIFEQPLPLYKTSPRTVRLFPANTSLLTLPSQIRKVFMPDCLEVDMASSQLAILAALWDVAVIRRFLAEGRSYWNSMIEHLCDAFPGNRYEPALFGEVKKILKGNTYGAGYGMSKRNLRRFGNPDRMKPKEREDYHDQVNLLETVFDADITEVGAAFLTHPVCAALLEAREGQLRRVRRRGGGRDCFGRFYAVGEEAGGKEITERTVLAAQAQAAEMQIMLELFREVRRAEVEAAGPAPAQILLWQHDGISVKVRRRRDIDL